MKRKLYITRYEVRNSAPLFVPLKKLEPGGGWGKERSTSKDFFRRLQKGKAGSTC